MRWLYFGSLLPEYRTATLTVVGDRLFGSSLSKTIEIVSANIVSVREYFSGNAFLRVTTTDGDFHVGVKAAEYDDVVRVLRQLVDDDFCQTFSHRLNVLFYRKQLTLWRFSLRTLLIATTLVAILLGLIAWLK